MAYRQLKYGFCKREYQVWIEKAEFFIRKSKVAILWLNSYGGTDITHAGYGHYTLTWKFQFRFSAHLHRGFKLSGSIEQSPSYLNIDFLFYQL